jgi:hypothetical protein
VAIFFGAEKDSWTVSVLVSETSLLVGCLSTLVLFLDVLLLVLLC